MSIAEARDWIIEESPLRRANVSTALVVDSSGSMRQNDPQDRRLDAGEAYLVAAERDDEVGVVDFDGSASVLADPLQVGPYRDDLVSAIRRIDSSGGTNLGAGLQAGCDLLQESQGYLQAAIFLTDGSGSYSNEAACFAERGWPVYAFGLGAGANETLLAQIAADTGGYYRQLDSATNLVCEFQQVRAAIVDQPPQSCEPTGTINLDELIEFFFEVIRGLNQITFTNSWIGSDIEMTVVSPSGRVVDRSTVGEDLTVLHGATYETFTIREPEPGEWQVRLYGADIPEGGEPYTFSTVAIESPDSDGDGVPNDEDAYPDSDMRANVHVRANETGVANLVLGNGATFNDLIGTAAENSRNRGALVSAVRALANDWKRAGLVTGRQTGEITSAAARS
jgi:hypothetical protein